MKVQETVNRLQTLLSEMGANEHKPTPEEVWKAFKLFAIEPVDCEDDFVIVQVGDSEVMGDSYLDFCREFRLSDSEGDSWSEQMHAEFKATLPGKLGCKQTDCASYDYPNIDEFFAAVEKMPEFKMSLLFSEWSFEVYLTDV